MTYPKSLLAIECFATKTTHLWDWNLWLHLLPVVHQLYVCTHVCALHKCFSTLVTGVWPFTWNKYTWKGLSINNNIQKKKKIANFASSKVGVWVLAGPYQIIYVRTLLSIANNNHLIFIIYNWFLVNNDKIYSPVWILWWFILCPADLNAFGQWSHL